MLNRTLATTFAPGMNLKYDLAGANWMYLLPSLELEHILCIGTPSPPALTTLSRFGKQVTVVSGSMKDARRALGAIRENQGHETAVALDDSSGLPMAEESIHLVFVASRAGLQEISSFGHLREEVQRVLNRQGLIYFEMGPFTHMFQRRVLRKLSGHFGESQLFWLTPWYGEMQTAVPAGDSTTIQRFLRRKLHSPSLNISVLKRVIRRHKPVQNGAGPSATMEREREEMDLFADARARSRAALRAAGARAISALTRVEKVLMKQNRLARRYGGFIGVEADVQLQRPPRYLRVIAQSAGVEIDDYRWGFSARGRYSSRKLLFFLFHPEGAENNFRDSSYIVKMVRDSSFNPRLENEYQALAALEKKGISGAPRAVFFGRHNGLAIVGESLVDGEPFRRKTDASAECRYARAVIEWLTDLGVATACSSAATPRQVARGLSKLLDRFTELYSPSQEEYALLSGQIATVSCSDEAFPLVFQHGDPGAWNIFITGDDRVAFLDWEAAETQGMPLWDLFYFLRSFSTWAARENGTRDTLEGFSDQFLAEGPLGRLIAEATERYCQHVGLPRLFVEPLFYTCWMHRALKQATSLRQTELAGGHYVNLLRLTIRERQSSPVLRRLFSGPESKEQT